MPRPAASRSTASSTATVPSTCAAAPSPRFETRFQLAWVAGALVPVVFLDVIDRRSGFFLLALVLFFSGLSYVAGLRARRGWGGVRAEPPALGEKSPELESGNDETA